MLVLGLTGSIGMGKSTVAGMLRAMNVPLFDADAAVHALYAPGGAAVQPVAALCPAALKDGGIDRAELARHVLADSTLLPRIEAVVHPLVHRLRLDFLESCRARGEALVVLDIPLLFEGRAKLRQNGAAATDNGGMDHVIVVSAPAADQRARVLARPGMTVEKFEAILARQVPDAEKRQQADFVIDTGVSLAETEAQVAALVQRLREKANA